MIWFDLVTPKSVLFFEPIINELKINNEILITSRSDSDYNEVNKLLKLKKLTYYSFSGYGGSSLSQKLDYALNRQKKLNDFIQGLDIDKLINLCSVDGCRVAFGNGIDIINFCDFPTSKDNQITHVARLTLPLSTKIFYPFYIPSKIFSKYCDNIVQYDFLDPVIYLQNQQKNQTFFESLDIDKNKTTILFREEEYKSSYVDTKTSFAHNILKDIDVNLIILPRYDNNHLNDEFPNAIILKEKIDLSHILPFVDLFIGGGGTINIEAIYWNTPVISTRSFLCYYDKYLIEQELMYHARNDNELKHLINKILVGSHNNTKYLEKRTVDIKELVKSI